MSKHLIIKFWALCLFVFSAIGVQAADDAVALGKTLFKANCAQCHAGNMKTKGTGPALAGVQDRWKDFPREDLYNWIRNSQSMVAAGHPRAVQVWNEWKPVVMNNFPTLKNEEIEAILAYIDFQVAGPPPPPNGVKPEEVVEEEGSNGWLIGGLALVLGALAFVLSRIVGDLDRMAKVKAGLDPGVRLTLLEQVTSPRVMGFVTFAMVLLFGYFTINNGIQLGRQQGYEPEQPINFSHALHAGKNKIDCQYCHDSARRSKHSSIPGQSTCMNCHAAVAQGQHVNAVDKGNSSAEILKIYSAAGYDPEKGTYFAKDSVQPSIDDVKKRYAAWLNKQYADAGVDASSAAGLTAQAMDKVMPMFSKPIEWVRIHNLPDHVYFNHAQHVVAGGLQCQTCHGPVEKMAVVKQYSPLSMGWCINCHRKAEVRFADNPYYQNFEQYHEEIKSGKRSKVTVEDIGGLECQKCHY